MWMGYGPKCYVCLDCGFMGQYLSSADLDDLKQRKAT
jgi:hypothetical protein